MTKSDAAPSSSAAFPFISRRLERYPTGAEPQPETAQQLAARLAKETEWYGIVSAAGTGKTMLLNYLVERLRQSESTHAVVALDRIDLAEYSKITRPESAIGKLTAEIAQKLSLLRTSIIPPPFTDAEGSFVEWLLGQLPQLGHQASILLLAFDNLDELQDSVMRALHSRLKELHNRAADRVICLIATDGSLIKTGRDISPLDKILNLRTLADYDEVEFDQLREYAAQIKLRFGTSGWECLVRETEGYPYLIAELFHHLSEISSTRGIQVSHVEKAVEEAVHNRLPLPPFQTALRAVEQWIKTRLDEYTAVQPLQDLIQHGSLDAVDEVQVEPLIRKGIARLTPARRLVWRNPMVRKFFECQKDTIKQWLEVQQTLGHRLQAKGRIRVTLFLNLSRFIDTPHKQRFNAVRATSGYVRAVEQLEERLSMLPDEFRRFESITAKDDIRNEDRIRNIGSDLNIFTYQAAQHAFAPVYYLKNALLYYHLSSTLSNRVGTADLTGTAEDLVRAEWAKWDSMSVQLTHEGTACVRLVQEIKGQDESEKQVDIQPLSSVLKNMLGLEEEIRGEMDALEDEILELLQQGKLKEAQEKLQRISSFQDRQKARQQTPLSVQWEIAMCLVEMLLRDLFGSVENKPDLLWEDPVFVQPGSPDVSALKIVPGGTCEANAPIYPLHDRYVIFEFDKICDCPREADDDKTAILEAKDFDIPERQSEIAGLLEGVAIGRQVSKDDRELEYFFPEIKPEYAREQLKSDLSSWSGELCILTIDNALIYHKLVDRTRHMQPPDPDDGCKKCSSCRRHELDMMREIKFPTKHVEYPDYWRATVRGLEYLIGIRLVARLAAHITAESMADLDNIGVLDPPMLADLRARVSYASRLISLIREASIPLSLARADYAARKFDSLIQLSGIREAIGSAEANIRDLNASLVHYDESRTLASIEELTDKSQQSNIASITVTIIFAASVVVSTVAQILSSDATDETKGKLIISLSILVIVIAGLAALIAKWLMRQVEGKYEARQQRERTSRRS